MRNHGRPKRIRDLRETWLVLRVASLSCLVWLMLKFLKPPLILRLLTPRGAKNMDTDRAGAAETPAARAAAFDENRVRRMVRATDYVLSRRLPVLRGACLKRSLILFRFLNREGVPVRIHLGAAKNDGKLVAHSWLTLDGKPCFERTDPGEYEQLLEHSAVRGLAKPR